MTKISPLDRILFLLMSLLSAWYIAVGINDIESLPMIVYTIGFGTLVVAGLLLIILGWEALETPFVVVISSLIPTCISLGLVWDYLPSIRNIYFGFVIIGFLAILLTRLERTSQNLAKIILIIVHGVEGLVIFLLPISLVLKADQPSSFLLVGLGGALSGFGGLLLSFLRSGKPILPRSVTLHLLPGLLLATTASFVAGFSLR